MALDFGIDPWHLSRPITLMILVKLLALICNLAGNYPHVPFEQADIVQQLGCEMTEIGHIKVDPMRKTSVDGLLACGDCTTPVQQVSIAIAQGNMAGAVTAMELAEKEYMS
jgi:Pyridine nucleotide-disulphide oxidoreductase